LKLSETTEKFNELTDSGVIKVYLRVALSQMHSIEPGRKLPYINA